MLRNNYLMLVLALCITTTYAQDKLWEINLNEKSYKVGWIEQTNKGLILAANTWYLKRQKGKISFKQTFRLENKENIKHLY